MELWQIPTTDKVSAMKKQLSKGIGLKAKNNDGRTFLHIAAMSGALKMIKFLAGEYKAKQFSLDMPDNENYTPLHLAILNDQYDAAISLIERGAMATVNPKGKPSVFWKEELTGEFKARVKRACEKSKQPVPDMYSWQRREAPEKTEKLEKPPKKEIPKPRESRQRASTTVDQHHEVHKRRQARRTPNGGQPKAHHDSKPTPVGDIKRRTRRHSEGRRRRRTEHNVGSTTRSKDGRRKKEHRVREHSSHKHRRDGIVRHKSRDAAKTRVKHGRSGRPTRRMIRAQSVELTSREVAQLSNMMKKTSGPDISTGRRPLHTHMPRETPDLPLVGKEKEHKVVRTGDFYGHIERQVQVGFSQPNSPETSEGTNSYFDTVRRDTAGLSPEARRQRVWEDIYEGRRGGRCPICRLKVLRKDDLGSWQEQLITTSGPSHSWNLVPCCGCVENDERDCDNLLDFMGTSYHRNSLKKILWRKYKALIPHIRRQRDSDTLLFFALEMYNPQNLRQYKQWLRLRDDEMAKL